MDNLDRNSPILLGSAAILFIIGSCVVLGTLGVTNGDYTVVQISVFLVCGYGIWVSLRSRLLFECSFLLAILTLVYNPIRPFYLPSSEWALIDLGALWILIYCTVVYFRKSGDISSQLDWEAYKTIEREIVYLDYVLSQCGLAHISGPYREFVRSKRVPVELAIFNFCETGPRTGRFFEIWREVMAKDRTALSRVNAWLLSKESEAFAEESS